MNGCVCLCGQCRALNCGESGNSEHESNKKIKIEEQVIEIPDEAEVSQGRNSEDSKNEKKIENNQESGDSRKPKDCNAAAVQTDGQTGNENKVNNYLFIYVLEHTFLMMGSKGLENRQL